MQKTSKKALSLLLALIMALGLVSPAAQVAWAEDPAAVPVPEDNVITAGGTYSLADDATGTITIGTTDPVTIIGAGVTIDEAGKITSDAYENLKFDCSGTPGAKLTLKDMFLEDRDDTSPLVNFDGADNELNIEGTVVMDKYGAGRGTHANIHVPQDAALTIGGSGTLYLYKTSGGAGIGGSMNEMNGEITFAMTGSAFIKGTKQGAVIGAGTDAKGAGTPGRVTFLSGEYNLISNSRGAVIGGSAGGEGASQGTEVYFRGGTVNINTDFSGSSVGGGGYDSGNDSSGGSVYFTGGSVRTYVDKNAAKNVGSTGYYKGLPMPEGVNNVSMTALRTNEAGEDVYLCIVDTKDIAPNARGLYNVKVDGADYYTGGLHQYGFIQEGLDKGEQLAITSTPSNWYKNGETRLFLYLTGQDHTITINDKLTCTATFNASAVGTIAECNGGAFAQTAMTSVELDKSEVCLDKAGDTVQLKATVFPEGTPVAWSSADEKVATVDETGKVTAVGKGYTTITASCGAAKATCIVSVEYKRVYICPSQADAQVTISSGIVYTYREDTFPGEAVEAQGNRPAGMAYELLPGNYTATITKDGYYASQFSFAVSKTGIIAAVNSNKLNGNLANYLLKGTVNVLSIPMTEFVASTNPGAWDGKTLDVSWYSETAKSMTITTPAQLAGMAAIVNGIYNAEITRIVDDADGDGVAENYAPAEYARLANRKIIAGASSGDTSGPNGNNMVTTNDYWYGVKADGVTPADFKNQTVYIGCDLDMGGWQDADGNWTGARYMPIGGQSLMHYIDYGSTKSDGLSHLGSSFNGRLDGQGHILKNVYCDRYADGSNFGDSQSVGVVGRLGIHDNDYSAWKADNTKGNYPAVNPAVRNLALTGYVYARRSVGGIVGKIGQTSASNLGDGTTGGIIENCVNFATVHNTDSKGCGGIVGAGWNRGIIRNCANFGSISTIYNNPTGGIVGSDEVLVKNCYNMGQISAKNTRYAMAIGTNNAGASWESCYWLTGSAPGGGVYNPGSYKSEIHEITDNYDGTTLTAAAFMQSDSFVKLLNGASGRSYQLPGNSPIQACLAAAGYPNAPVPTVFTQSTATVEKVELQANPTKLAYVETQKVDVTGMQILATWSDGSSELLENYQFSVSPAVPLTLADTKITVSGVYGGKAFSFDIPITVEKRVVSDLRISTEPDRTMFAQGEKIDLTGMKVQASYSDIPGKYINLSTEEYTTSVNETGLVTVTYTYAGVTKEAALQLTMLDTPAPAQDEVGSYLLACVNDVLWFGGLIASGKTDANAKVMADITIPDTFKGIGGNATPYNGTFDGNGHTITVNVNTASSAALFAVVKGDAVLKDLTVAGSVTTTASSTGAAGLVAQVSGSSGTITIMNCVNKANVTAPAYVGGLVGKNTSSWVSVNIIGSSNEGTITSTAANNAYTGGLVGHYTKGMINGCTNSGTINAKANSVGGLVGQVKGNNSGMICHSSNTGAVTGSHNVGGIIGHVDSANPVVSESFNTGAVTATGNNANSGVGGIIGYSKGTVSDVYNLGTVSSTNAQATNFGVGGIIGHTMGYEKKLVTNAYNAGELVKASDNAYLGGIVGRTSGYANAELENTYFLESGELGPVGDYNGSPLKVTGQPKTSDELKALAPTLGDQFASNSAGYPLLRWQTITKVEAVPATCTQPGTAGYWTDANGSLYSDAQGLNSINEPVIIPALNHKNAQKTEAQAATCGSAGHEAYWTCPDCGKYLADESGQMDTGKTFDTADSFTVAATGIHTWDDGVVTVEPTVKADGEKLYTCTVCSATRTEKLPMRVLTEVKAVPATCTQPGTAGYWTDANGSLYSDAQGLNSINEPVIIPALNHKNAQKTEAQAATCGSAGHEAYWTCPDCGKYLADESGQMDTGKTFDTADSFTVAATGIHTWDDGVVTVEPTVKADGEKLYTCTVCSATRTESIPKLADSGEKPGDSGEKPNNGSVETGDSGVLLWIALFSVAALGTCVLTRKKREA